MSTATDNQGMELLVCTRGPRGGVSHFLDLRPLNHHRVLHIARHTGICASVLRVSCSEKFSQKSYPTKLCSWCVELFCGDCHTNKHVSFFLGNQHSLQHFQKAARSRKTIIVQMCLVSPFLRASCWSSRWQRSD